jgi:hypothetical protein
MKELVSVTQSGLERLGFEYTKNGASELVEFEVSKPAPFLVRITHLAEIEHPSVVLGLGYSSRQRESTDFRIQFNVESAAARANAAGLVRHVLTTLKKPPWKGLGFIEGGTAKALWRRAAEGRE